MNFGYDYITPAVIFSTTAVLSCDIAQSLKPKCVFCSIWLQLIGLFSFRSNKATSPSKVFTTHLKLASLPLAEHERRSCSGSAAGDDRGVGARLTFRVMYKCGSGTSPAWTMWVRGRFHPAALHRLSAADSRHTHTQTWSSFVPSLFSLELFLRYTFSCHVNTLLLTHTQNMDKCWSEWV